MDGRLRTRDARLDANAGAIPTHALDRFPAGMMREAVGECVSHRLGVLRRLMGLLERFDHDVARTGDRAIRSSAHQGSEEVFSRWSMTLLADAIEQSLLDKELPKSALVWLDGR